MTPAAPTAAAEMAALRAARRRVLAPAAPTPAAKPSGFAYHVGQDGSSADPNDRVIREGQLDLFDCTEKSVEPLITYRPRTRARAPRRGTTRTRRTRRATARRGSRAGPSSSDPLPAPHVAPPTQSGSGTTPSRRRTPRTITSPGPRRLLDTTSSIHGRILRRNGAGPRGPRRVAAA